MIDWNCDLSSIVSDTVVTYFALLVKLGFENS